MAEKYNAEFIELDCFEQNYGMTDDQLKQAGEPFFEYLTKNKDGIEFRRKSQTKDRPSGKDLVDAVNKFCSWLFKWCNSHRNKKWVIEGVQLYSCANFDEVKQYPMIIKNTSMVKSIYRREKRDGHTDEFVKMIQWYLEEEKMLSEFKNNFIKSTESYLVSKKDVEYNLEDFESGKSNILLITGLSRSGKTTLGKEYANKYNATLIELDLFENFNVDIYQKLPVELIKIRNEFLNSDIGKEYSQKYLSGSITDSEYHYYMKKCFYSLME